MKYYGWDEEKNQKLKDQRNISFEEIQLAVENSNLIDDFDHPNQKQYPGQRIMVVEVNDYAYLVPYVKEGEKVFLKTIIPNRKATKKYLKSK